MTYHVIPVKMSALPEEYVQIHQRSVEHYKMMIILKGKYYHMTNLFDGEEHLKA